MRIVIAATIFLIVGVLAMSSISKLRDRAGFVAFADALVDMGLVPARWARPVAALSVTSEVVVAAVLLWPTGALPGLAAAAALFAVFTAGLATAVRRDARVGCHCFGVSSSPVARRHVLRGGFLCAVALGGLCATVATSANPLAGIGAPQMLAAAAVAAVGVAALIWIDDLVWLFRGAAPSS
jgi:hypothetical protein